IRFPEKLVLGVPLAVAVCAAAGWDRLAEWRKARGPGLAAAACAACAIAALAAPLPVGRLGPERAASLRDTALRTVPQEFALAAVAIGVLALLGAGRIRLRAAQAAVAALLALDLGGPAAQLDRSVPAADLVEPVPLEE